MKIYEYIYPDTLEKIEKDLLKQIFDKIQFLTENGIQNNETDEIKNEFCKYIIMLQEISNYYLKYPLYNNYKVSIDNINKINTFIENNLITNITI